MLRTNTEKEIKKNEKSAYYFAINVFKEMHKKRREKHKDCYEKHWRDWAKIMVDRSTWYKFVYSLVDWEYVLITFAVYSKFDEEIGRLISYFRK